MFSSCGVNTLFRMARCSGWQKSSLGADADCWFYHEAAHLRSDWVPDWKVNLCLSFCFSTYVSLNIGDNDQFPANSHICKTWNWNYQNIFKYFLEKKQTKTYSGHLRIWIQQCLYSILATEAKKIYCLGDFGKAIEPKPNTYQMCCLDERNGSFGIFC